MTYETYLFDLDGTLTEPFEGITNSVAYALKKFGIDVTDKRPLAAFIGPPLAESFSVCFGFSKTDAWKAVEYYREYYAEKGIFENRLYEGIPSLLAELKNRGKKLIVATSKPEFYAEKILRHFGIADCFDYVAGATMDGSRLSKTDVIAYALRSCGILQPEGALMVGDRKHDVIGAKENGLRSAGVLYGYGSREELTNAGADYLAETPADVLQIGERKEAFGKFRKKSCEI